MPSVSSCLVWVLVGFHLISQTEHLRALAFRVGPRQLVVGLIKNQFQAATVQRKFANESDMTQIQKQLRCQHHPWSDPNAHRDMCAVVLILIPQVRQWNT